MTTDPWRICDGSGLVLRRVKLERRVGSEIEFWGYDNRIEDCPGCWRCEDYGDPCEPVEEMVVAGPLVGAWRVNRIRMGSPARAQPADGTGDGKIALVIDDSEILAAPCGWGERLSMSHHPDDWRRWRRDNHVRVVSRPEES